MNTLKRILRNIKWAIFNHPPITLRHTQEPIVCDYCKTSDYQAFQAPNLGFTICVVCIKKMADKVLKEDQDNV